MSLNNTYLMVGLILVLSIGYLTFTSQPVPLDLEREVKDHSYVYNVIEPLTAPDGLDVKKVNLGRKLFHEVRLSRDNTISCASCHDLARGGVDGLRFSIGINGSIGDANAPTVFNSGFNFVQFWDGRAATLEEQASGPVHSPVEMDSNWDQVTGKLRQDASYMTEFQAAYGQGPAEDTIVDAIARFQRSLVTVNSRFDQFLRGDEHALNYQEKEGYRIFQDYGCTSCHQGVNIGGNMFQRFGVMGGYFEGRELSRADLGRFNVTGIKSDKHVFKVPSLRNVALTSPYFHDGSAETLEDAIEVMGKYQLGRELKEYEIRSIAAFLHTLTGEWQVKEVQ